jgi:hypothetical protein
MSVRGISGAGTPPLGELFMLVIGARNDFLHTYADVATLLAERDIGAGVGEMPLALEFFDSRGQRYAGRYDAQWRLVDLVPTGEPPDLDGLLRRVEAVRDHMRSFIRQRRDVVELYGMTQDEALAVFESPAESRVLAGAVRPFAPGGADDDLFPAGAFGDEDDQGIWHNLIHHGHT